MNNGDLISRSALIKEFRARMMDEVVPDYKYLSQHGKDSLSAYAIVVRELIFNAPTVDTIEVIRCKDCTLYGPSPYGHPTIGWCKMHGTHYKPEFFCGLAERKEEKG